LQPASCCSGLTFRGTTSCRCTRGMLSRDSRGRVRQEVALRL
jgi:hypothetical protein